MRNVFLLGLVLAVLATLLPELGLAQEINNSNAFWMFPEEFQNIAGEWEDTFKKYAKYLFFTLGVIHFALHFGFLAVEGLEFQKLITELVRFIMFFGFFYWLLDNGPWLASTIIDSCVKIGMEASATPADGADLVDLGFGAFARAVAQINLFNVLFGFITAIIVLAVLIILTLAAVNLLIEYCAAWVLIYAGFFVLGLGSTSWTRDIAINYLKTVLQAGLRIMSIILILGVGKSVILNAFREVVEGNDMLAIKMHAVILMTSIMLLIMIVKVPPMIGSLVTGGSHNNPTIGLGRVLAAAAIAIKAAVDIKTLGASKAASSAISATSKAASSASSAAASSATSATSVSAPNWTSSSTGVPSFSSSGAGSPTGVRAGGTGGGGGSTSGAGGSSGGFTSTSTAGAGGSGATSSTAGSADAAGAASSATGASGSSGGFTSTSTAGVAGSGATSSTAGSADAAGAGSSAAGAGGSGGGFTSTSTAAKPISRPSVTGGSGSDEKK